MVNSNMRLLAVIVFLYTLLPVHAENFYTGDGDRFSQQAEITNGNKNPKSFENYLKRKEARAAARRTAKQKPLDPNETSSRYTNVH